MKKLKMDPLFILNASRITSSTMFSDEASRSANRFLMTGIKENQRDVYKRQHRNRPEAVTAMNEVIFILLVLPCMKSVSYTHLDVYKRQVYAF